MKKKFLWVISIFIVGSVTALWGEQVEFGGELRLRPEYRGNPDFNDGTNESNSFVGSRLRITGTGKAADDVLIKVTFQDSRNWGEEPGAANGLTDTGEAVDIHEGFVEFSRFLNSPFSLRAGRQELSYGDQRLVGNFGWSNQGRAFDAFKLFIDNSTVSLDVFAAKRKENNGTTAATPSMDRDLSGVYSSWKKLIPKTIADLYVLYDREGDTSTAAKSKNVYTVGARLAGRTSGLDYAIESPFQFGDNGTVVGVSSQNVKISAYAIAAKAGYTFEGAKEIRIGLEYDFASGDSNSSDTTAKTFNNFYPTNHIHYGLMDNQGWRNMEAWNASISGNPAAPWFTSLSLWNFMLAEEKDGWYNAGGSASGSLRAPSATNTSSNVGNEVDLLVRFVQSPKILWEAGYGHFFTGPFINNRIQSEADSDWAYIMSTVKF